MVLAGADGPGPAGFYTYQWFENGVLHLDIHNADRIVPEWQDVKVGHRIWFYPESYVIKPRGGTWQFVLEPIGNGATRLILRARSGTSPTRAFDIVAELGYFVLTRGMLLGIKQRAESVAA